MSERYRLMSVACRYFSRRRRWPTSSSRPRRLWWSCLWVFRCSVRSVMRCVSSAIWTSGLPVSPSLRAVLGDDGPLCVRVKRHRCVCVPLGRNDHQRPDAWLVRVAVPGAPAPWPSRPRVPEGAYGVGDLRKGHSSSCSRLLMCPDPSVLRPARGPRGHPFRESWWRVVAHGASSPLSRRTGAFGSSLLAARLRRRDRRRQSLEWGANRRHV